MNYSTHVAILLTALLLAGCSTPAIISDQLGRNATEMLHIDRNLTPDCRVIITDTRTPSSWWVALAPVSEVKTTVECIK